MDQQPRINFFAEDIEFELADEQSVITWLAETAIQERNEISELSIIFCSDDYLLEVNREHLDHDYYTDIITFPYTESPVSGDLFISVDRVCDNAKSYAVTADHELNRVMVHGVLHLLGYGDKTEEEATMMRVKEDFYLGKLGA